MTGLRQRARDAVIPERAGEPELSPPAEDAARAWIAAALLGPDAPSIESVAWEHARWKPGVSVACAYRVRLAGGTERLVGLKRYVGEKPRHLADRALRVAPDLAERCAPLLPRAVLPEERTLLWTFPADRVLRGMARLLDARKTARLLEGGGLAPSRALSRKALAFELLRYKPERRAVLAVAAPLRGAEDGERRAIARVLAPDAATVSARVRSLFDRSRRGAGGGATLPRLLAAEPPFGILVEEWLDVVAAPADGFDRAAEAGAALAALHATPLPPDAPDRRVGGSDDARALGPLLGTVASFRRAPFGVHRPAAGRRTWVHGDLHPDQVARRRDGGTALLDLDQVGAGDPAADLASWVADRLVAEQGADPAAAGGELLEAYRAAGGCDLPASRLRAHVAAELVARAAAALRRLEAGAEETAALALALARKTAPGEALRTW